MLSILNYDNIWRVSKSWPFSYTKYKSVATQKVKNLQYYLQSWTVDINIFKEEQASHKAKFNKGGISNLHHKQNIPFMNIWCALQRTTMPEDNGVIRLTQLNGAITDFHTNIHPCIHEWKSHKRSMAQFNQYLVLKFHLQIKFQYRNRSNKRLNS